MKLDIMISGLGPSDFGVGRLNNYLDSAAKQNGVRTLFKYKSLSHYKSAKAKKDLLRTISAFIKLFGEWIVFFISVRSLKDKHILLIHPQSIGLKETLGLLKRNHVHLYVMDNFFFCLKSYNYRNGRECLDCIGGISQTAQTCEQYPHELSRKSTIFFIQELLIHGQRVHFIAQNESQKKLLKLHFGEDIQCNIVPIFTDEIKDLLTISDETSKRKIVYHGTNFLAKGLFYFVELAQNFPDASFIIPSHREDVSKVTGLFRFSDNVIFKPCSWETGLRELVTQSDITVCPSLWSAPIEGALLKSLAFAKTVAVVETEYGFSNEIPTDCIIRLPANPSQGASLLQGKLNEQINLSEEARDWLSDFLKNAKNQTDQLFS